MDHVSDLLLQTKLFKPALRPALITRRQLIARLNAGLGSGSQDFAARLTLVSAPAGFGKTTLISAWLAQLGTFDPQFSDESKTTTTRFISWPISSLLYKRPFPALGKPP
jgi:LuxR family maltose regulon positive regulatory protein